MTVAIICALLIGHGTTCDRGARAHHVPEHSRGGQALALTPVETGERLTAARGWTGAAWRCFYELGRRESGWRVAAVNRSSGATGIGQALPASKMARYGRDYLTSARTQVRWMIAYVSGRYGDPCSAVAFHNGHGYY